MNILRFIISIFLLIGYHVCTLSAAEINIYNTQSSYSLGLRAPFRLPVFYDDANILRFVSRTTPLSDASYAPTDLMSISGAYINQAGRNSVLRKVARDTLSEMAE